MQLGDQQRGVASAPACAALLARIACAPPMRRSPLAILFVTVFLDLLGFGIVIPFLAYYVESFGSGAATVGLMMSSFSLAQFVFAPLWGSLSDRIGRRPVLLIGLLGSVVGYALFGFAASVAWLFASRILAGIAGASIPTAQAYIADSTTLENRAKGMGIIGAAFGLGFVLGPAAGGLLSGAAAPIARFLGGPLGALFLKNPYALPSLAAAALALINLIAAFFLLPESLTPELRERARHHRPGRFQNLRDGLTGEVGLYIAAFAVFILAHSMMEATATLLVQERLHVPQAPEAQAKLVRDIGWLFALVGVVSAFGQGFLVGRLTRIFGERKLLVAGLAISGLALGAIPSFATLGWSGILPCFGLLAFGSALASPSVNSLISRAAPPDRQGAVLGAAQSAGSLARVFGPSGGGALFQHLFPAAPYLTAGALTLGAMALALFAPPPRDYAPKPQPIE